MFASYPSVRVTRACKINIFISSKMRDRRGGANLTKGGKEKSNKIIF